MTTIKNFLASRDYRLILIYVTQANIGNAIFTIALSFLTLQLTGSASKMAITFALKYLPFALVPFTATWLDRNNIKIPIVFSNLAQGLIVTIFSLFLLFKSQNIWIIYAISFFDSLLQVLPNPAYSKLLPFLFAKEHITRANSIIMNFVSIANIVGLLIGGILVTKFGATKITLLYGVNVTLLTTYLCFIKMPKISADLKINKQKFFQDFATGIKMLLKIRVIFILLIIIFSINAFIGAPFDVLMPLQMTKIGKGPNGLGLFDTFLIVGNLFGSTIITFLGNKLKDNFGVYYGLCLLVISLFGLGLCKNYHVMLFFGFATGVSLIAITIYTTAIKQKIIASEYLGRITGYIDSFGQIGNPISLLILSSFINKISISSVFIFGAILTTSLVVIWKVSTKKSPLYTMIF